MKTLIFFLAISALIFFKNDFCLGQYQYGWKQINDYGFYKDYIDTLNIKTYDNKTFFFIKNEYPNSDFKKINIGTEDSSYCLYCIDTSKPSITLISEVGFYSNGTVMLRRSESGKPMGPDLLKYGLGNIVFEEYYRLVTRKSLVGFPIKKDDGN